MRLLPRSSKTWKSNDSSNVFFKLSPSGQCTEAANRARRLSFVTRSSFQDRSKLAFISSYRALVRPHLKYYGMPPACSPNQDINHFERILRLATGLVIRIRHLPYKERLQLLGLHSLQRPRLQAELITAFKISTGPLDIDPYLSFLLPTQRVLIGQPYKVLRGASHRRRIGSTFSVGFAEYWNKLQASIVTAFFSRKRREFGKKSFSNPPYPLLHLHTTY